MQLNGINIQPKIGSDFAAQYGEANSVNNATTMQNTNAAQAQMYNNDKVTQNHETSKTPEKIDDYATAQANAMTGAKVIAEEMKFYHLGTKVKND